MLDKLYTQVPTSFKIATAKKLVESNFDLFGARPRGPFVIGVLGKA